MSLALHGPWQLATLDHAHRVATEPGCYGRNMRYRGLGACELILALSLVGCGGKSTSVVGTLPPGAEEGSGDGSGGSVSVRSGGSGSGGIGSSSGSDSGGSASGSSGGSDLGSSAGSDGSSSGRCGVAGEPCCGTSCNADSTCVVIGGASECEACGQPGQVCCTTMPACTEVTGGCFYHGSLQYCMSDSAAVVGQPGTGCSTTCTDANTTCMGNGMSSYCIACGGLGNPCCGMTCETSLQCSAGTCQGGGPECQTPDDCTMLLGPVPPVCTQCSDGGQGCEHYVWICETTYCGAQPASSASECQTPGDCETLLGPIPPVCEQCPNGKQGCEHYVCLSGICQTTYCD